MAEAAGQLQDETAAAPEPPPPVHGYALLQDRYQIDPNTPLADMDTPSAKAYAALDRRDTGRQIFALICTPGLPPRGNLLAVLRGNGIPGMLPMVDAGTIEWPPLGQRCMAVLYERPLGGKLAANAFGSNALVNEHDVVRRVIDPAVRTLLRLSARGFTHRAVRPNNMYFMDSDMREVVLGDCVTSPAAFDQPAIFETIERAMASPAGRGEGSYSNDLYSLGVSLVFLMLGRNPVQDRGPDQLLQAKVDRGSYGAICGNERLPLALIEPLRGLLGDDPDSRWTFEDIQMWLAGARRSSAQRRASPKADNGMVFNGREYFSTRTLAHVFSQSPADAAPVIRDGRLEAWLRRQLVNAELADAVQAAIEVARAHQTDPLGSDDYLVAKVCILLDPAGPIRYRGFSFMPEGFGPALAVEILRRGETQIPAEVIARDIPSIWVGAQDGNRPLVAGIEKTFAQLRTFLQSSDMGQGIERCLYHVNPSLPCQSSLLVKDYVVDLRDLLHALEEASKHIDTKTRPLDRHITAFLAAHTDLDLTARLRALTATDEQTATLAMLNLLATLQERLGVEGLFALASWVGGHLAPAIASYRSRSTRRDIEREMPRIVRLGSLPQLLDLVDNAAKRQNDRDGVNQAGAQFAAAQAEIDSIVTDDDSRQKEAEATGQQTAAMISVVLTMIIISVVSLVKTW